MNNTDLDFSAWLHPGDTLMWGQANAEPLTLTRLLVAQRHSLPRVRLFLGIGASETLQPEHADAFDFVGYAGSGQGILARAGLLDIVPSHYSHLPHLIESGRLRVDVLLLQVSLPDAHGRYSLGLAHDYLLTSVDRARVVIAEVNEGVPWTHGERTLTASDFDLLVPAAHPPIDLPAARVGEAENAIGRYVADLIDDGATLQIGVGNVPEAVLRALLGHRALGIHSGALCDGVVALCESGVLTNERKNVDRDLTVAGILMGGQRLRKWAHRNPNLSMRGTAYTHDAAVLASLERFVAINSAIEVDLTGQINAEVAGGIYVGAVGGALDFLRAAARSYGGLPIVALPSTARGRSRIVAQLSGAVSTPRSDAGLIVTEYGVADLRGATLSQRARRMIEIAAPEHRPALELEAQAL